MTGIIDGSHNVTVCTNDTDGLIGCANPIYFTTFTPEPPALSITNPSGSYAFGSPVPIDYTVIKGTNNIDQCWYSTDLNLTNITLPLCSNTTLLSYPSGSHFVRLSINDTMDLKGTFQRNFTVLTNGSITPGGNVTVNVTVTGVSDNTVLFVAVLALIIVALLFLMVK